ncbi:hypothetical protein [Pyrococcus kukulkanii]|uniref:Uncharacterized protein n=1 Tax=Pyrococcus kukulkanii TaxID=1609559 RepID=A0ABV4T282_9EURY
MIGLAALLVTGLLLKNPAPLILIPGYLIKNKDIRLLVYVIYSIIMIGTVSTGIIEGIFMFVIPSIFALYEILTGYRPSRKDVIIIGLLIAGIVYRPLYYSGILVGLGAWIRIRERKAFIEIGIISLAIGAILGISVALGASLRNITPIVISLGVLIASSRFLTLE